MTQQQTQIAEGGEQMGGGECLDARNFGLVPLRSAPRADADQESHGGAIAGNGFARSPQMAQSEPNEPQSGISSAPRSSLEFTDNQAAAVAVAPRVTLSNIEAAILERFDIGPNSLFEILGHASVDGGKPGHAPTYEAVEALKPLSVCILVMRNGFTVIGKSAPASPENFNAELGRKFAYEDAVRQLWPLMGFALRDRLAESRSHPPRTE
jgi:hypothetical protein